MGKFSHGFSWVDSSRGGARPTPETLFDVSSRRPADILLLLSRVLFHPPLSLVVFLSLSPPSPAFNINIRRQIPLAPHPAGRSTLRTFTPYPLSLPPCTSPALLGDRYQERSDSSRPTHGGASAYCRPPPTHPPTPLVTTHTLPHRQPQQPLHTSLLAFHHFG
jgi:hypothetical protein